MSNSIYIQSMQSESWYNKWFHTSYYSSAEDTKQDLVDVQQLINNVFDIFRAENDPKTEKEYVLDGAVISKGMAGLCAKIENLF